SYLSVALEARGRILGVLTFASTRPERIYSTSDLKLAQGLASRAAAAIDNAALYRETQEARDAAETQRRAADEARLAAEEAGRAKDEFLAVLSHELRTPLTATLGWVHLLRTNKVDAATEAHAVDAIDRSSRAQAQLIEDLLDVSRIINGKMPLEVQPIKLVPVLEAALESVRLAAEAKGIRLRLALDTLDGVVNGDSGRLQQVVWNLLSNAVKFTPKGGSVEVRLERVDSKLQVSVIDSGRGIEPEFLPYVFDRFRQADSTSTRAYGGLGLGLSIVKHLVEMHGGTVSVASDGMDKGSVFRIRIPMLPVSMQQGYQRTARRELWAESAEDSINTPAVDGALPAFGGMLQGIRIVILEDENDARELLGLVVIQHGAEVKLAATVRQALKLCNEFRPHVVVSDIGLPGEDGYAFIAQLRSRTPEEGGEIPVIALTAYARVEDRIKALAAGFHTHITKPVEPPDLVAAIAMLVGRTQAGQQLPAK
ncbi:MAG TPA: ATP-binding protein, partial [Abditibacteriaceae bacterium]